MMLKEVSVIWKFQEGIHPSIAERIKTFIGNRQVPEHDTCEELELCSSANKISTAVANRYTVQIFFGQPVEVVVRRHCSV